MCEYGCDISQVVSVHQTCGGDPCLGPIDRLPSVLEGVETGERLHCHIMWRIDLDTQLDEHGLDIREYERYLTRSLE